MIHIVGAILAGGLASRMGSRDKALLEHSTGKTFALHILEEMTAAALSEVVISANDPEPYRSLGCPIVPDLHSGCGPLAGVEAVLDFAGKTYSADGVLFLPCDMPAISRREIKLLMDAFAAEPRRVCFAVAHDAPVPRRHPCCCVVPVALLGEIKRALGEGQFKIGRVWDGLDPNCVEFKNARGFCNINTPEEFALWKKGIN